MSLTAALLLLSLAQARPASPAPPPPAAAGTAAPRPAVAQPTEAVLPKPAGPATEPAPPEFGLSLDASIPEGAALAFAYRPLPFIRVWAGPAWNYAALGLQGGLGIVLVPWAVTPVLSVEAGRFLATDVSPYLKRAGSIPSEMLPLLKDVRYTYVAAHLGLEMGSQRGFSFGVRLGLARLSIRTSGTGQVITNAGTPEEGTLVFVNPRFGGTAPSLKLGFNYWF